jgi:hypothetical protein
MPYIEKGESCKTAVEFVTADDLRPPARSLNITIRTKSGKTVIVTIPNDAPGYARVRIDGEEV